MLSKRQILASKWRTALVSLAILALFHYGPSWRGSVAGRAGRRLLTVGSESEVEDSAMASDEQCPAREGEVRPDCEEQEEETWKIQLKKWFKNAPDPADDCAKISCSKNTAAAIRECKNSEEGPTPEPDTWSLSIGSNQCKVHMKNCTKGTNSFEPIPEDDPMFPEDVFSAEQRASGAIILHIIGILYMFYALALVCDHYFVPTLDVIIEKFQISDDVAGATFMAAGGSAPELFTSVIGVFIAVSDVGIGTIVGSAVFNVLFVIAACAFASEKALSLTAWPLIRDTTFYSIALIVLVGFFMDDVIEWWEALVLFLWYFAYVIFMKFNAVVEAKFLEIFPSLAAKKEEEPAVPGHRTGGFKWHGNRKPLLFLMRTKVDNQPEEQELNPGVGLPGLKDRLQGAEEGEKLNPPKEFELSPEAGTESEYKDYVRTGPGDTIVSKLMYFVSLPLMVPMWLTIPDPQDPKRAKFFPIAFIFSIVWIAVFSYFMVWWATLVGDTIGISDAVMGLTFLAAGTSVPDLITSVLVAKEGKGDMAVSSSIGSNLFDVTVGLPLPWLLYTIINQKAMQVNSVGMGCSIGMLFLMLLLVFVSILLFKWQMTKPMGGVMLGLYVVFVIVSLGLSECWFPCFI